ncbi:MAG TPA: SMI1/KNR4 family protein [Sphingomonadaceae bacterium]|nr:SMI1/KNR4 family protein [Sphingomonadaceae bacterium]
MKQKREDFDLLCREGDVSGPIGDEAIGRAEAELGVQFPAEYRELLRQYGAVQASGLEVYGLLDESNIDDPPVWQDVVSITKKLRGWGQAGTEKHEFVPISEDGTGVYFYLDTSEAPRTKICAVGPGVEKVFDTDLFSFLFDLAKGHLVF